MRERSPATWELIVPLARDPLTRRKRYRSRTFRGTKRDAQRALRELASAVDDGRMMGREMTLSDLLAQWLDLCRDELSPTTLREYRRLIAKRIGPALGPVSIAKLTTPELDNFYKALTREASLSPSSVRHVHSIIRRALRQAVRWGWIAHNPAVNASPPRLRHDEITPPSLDELRLLLAAADRYDASFGVLVRVATATGLRRGEVCGLRWNDVDLDRKRLHVRRAVVAIPDGAAEKDTKTHASRKMTLDAITIAALRSHCERSAALAETCGVALPRDAYVFSHHPDGSRPLHPDNVTAAFRRLAKREGLAGVRFHDLRHAHATQLLAAGVPLRTVSGRLGHANASTTLNIYAHVVEESDEQASSLIEQLLEPPPS
jgi:integrase